MSRNLRLSATAADDIRSVLDWTGDRLGEQARWRYQRLIGAALLDIREDPFRTGSVERTHAGPTARSWHLRGSRDHAKRLGAVVARPRHILLYRLDEAGVSVGRVLHEAMDLRRHETEPHIWE